MIPTKNKVGESKGSVMRLRICRSPAPSIRAASYSSREMLVRPARKITVWKPMKCQIVKMDTATSDRLGPASESGTPAPNAEPII
ncbi:MAG: hypothetical protein AUH39_03930 [Chloroflexi bacterium 13_1_40CM_67_9]|nr:MAG: hypothetical protein AUH39_03930 [Chloroflexi bacterium 13_1_40CM_67_9]